MIKTHEKNKKSPNYKRIYADIITKKHPEKLSKCEKLLSKDALSFLDVITINNIIFGVDQDDEVFNRRHRSYEKATVFEILDYQKKHKLNNSQLAKHFKLSRNTVTKWKKIFL